MKHTILSILALVLLFSAVFADESVSSGELPANSDTNYFLSLYRNIEQIVVPKYDAKVGSPTQVLLFEMPGLAINRDELDLPTWQANGFRGRQPDAVVAQFVDRLPYYTSPTFVDSGSTISRTWGFFLYQYIIPVLDNPVQEARVNAAREALNNGTLVSAYDAASAAYEQSYSDLVNFRSACLARSGGGVCSGQAVVYRERLKRKWFTLEVARRDIAAAEAKIIALQIQDLKNVFAEQLFTYASNERVDMGDEGFGGSYYQTYCTPSNWYKWWAPSGAFDYVVTANSFQATLAIPATATIVQAPQHGTATPIMGGNYTYTPNTGYTGADSITFQDVDGSGNTFTKTYGIGVAGPDVYNADSAFVTVSATSSSSSKDTSSFSTTVKTHFDAKGGTGLLSVSGSADVSNTKTGESLTSSGSTFSSTFDIARVAITRPWLDTSILSYYPVAIRTINANGWSDGTITPADDPLTFKFKLLPVAFIVARNIKIETTFTSFASKLTTDSLSVGASIQVSYGPFFSGGASTNVDKTNRDYHEESKFSSNGLYIRGPQVIAWVCTALPAFPTADEKTVRKWEEDNKNKADAQIEQVTKFSVSFDSADS